MEFEKVREEDVLKLLEERKFADVRDLLKDMEPIDIAELLEEMPEEKLPLPVPYPAEGNGGGYVRRDGFGYARVPDPDLQ